MSKNKIIFLEQSKIPTHYYNVLADVPVPMDPPLHPGTKQPAGPQDLSAIFPMDLIMQKCHTNVLLKFLMKYAIYTD